MLLAHDYAAACPRLAQSEMLDPAPGTALNLALCYQQQGKLATAWAAYKTAQSLADRTGQKERLAVATKSAAELEPELSRMTIFVPPSSRVAGLEVRIDGDKIGEFEWGVAMPRDGGGHDIEASAPGKQTWRRHVDLQESGGRVTAEIPALEGAYVLPANEQPSSSPPSAVGAESGFAGAASSDDQAMGRPPGKTQRVVGLTIGAAGLLGVGAGGLLALVAKSDFSTAQGEHGESRVNDSASAVHLVNTATVVVIAGGVLAAAGAVVWLSSPRAPAQVGTNGRELFLKGRF
ncbi:MAG: hypothetical protein M3O36_20150 [Myxococcota bacterium]|nr:hypothetical protein [Myxococcota bacterium]